MLDTEVKVPAALLTLGVAGWTGYWLQRAGLQGVWVAVLATTVYLPIMVALGIGACFITSRLIGTSFGYLRTAILKLAAIEALTSTVWLWSPYAGWVAAIVLYFVLLRWLFDIQFAEAFILDAVLWIVTLLTVVVAAVLFLWCMR